MEIIVKIQNAVQDFYKESMRQPEKLYLGSQEFILLKRYAEMFCMAIESDAKCKKNMFMGLVVYRVNKPHHLTVA